jgi:transposase-like protein
MRRSTSMRGPGGVRTVVEVSFDVGYTHGMSKRLQVVMDEDEYREIERIARRHGVSVSGWVRHVLRRARRSEPAAEAGRKLEVVRAAARHEFPTADIDQMLREIERGYLGEER